MRSDVAHCDRCALLFPVRESAKLIDSKIISSDIIRRVGGGFRRTSNPLKLKVNERQKLSHLTDEYSTYLCLRTTTLSWSSQHMT